MTTLGGELLGSRVIAFPQGVIKNSLEFVVQGIPMQQGSKWAFVNKHTGRAQMLDQNSRELRAWRGVIIERVRAAFGVRDPWAAVAVELDFYFQRPASQFKSDGSLRSSAHREKITRPDLDKLVRAVYDALTQSGVITDDGAIVESRERKAFGLQPGVSIQMFELEL